MYDQDIDHLLPSSLTSLDLGERLNLPITSLPPLLSSISFGTHFNQPLEDFTFPPSLKTIQFGGWFNQQVDYNLPFSLLLLLSVLSLIRVLTFSLLLSLFFLLEPLSTIISFFARLSFSGTFF